MGRVMLSTLAISSLLIFASVMPAQDRGAERRGGAPAAPGSRDLDARLLDGLRTEPAGNGPATATPEVGRGNDAQQRPPDRSSDPSAAGSDIGQQNPLARIGGQMRQVEQRLAAQDVSRETQQRQQQIVAELDQLIAALAARQQQSQRERKSSASSQTKEQAAKSSAEAAQDSQGQAGSRPVEAEASAAMREAVGEVWGHLPERFRRQMQNAGAVEFLPKYRQLIEDYYKRLAEDRGIHR